MNTHPDIRDNIQSKQATVAQFDSFDVAASGSPNGCIKSEIASALATSSVVQQILASCNNSKQQQSQGKTEMARKIAKQHKKWNKRLKIFFCCLGYKKNKDSIADVASIFAEFYADLKVPSSDIAAGFVLLSKYQAAQRQWIVRNSQDRQLGIEQYLSGIPIKEDTKFLDLSTADDSHLVNDLIYYLNYSLAIFGWPMHLVDDPCLLCCIYPYLRLSLCSSSRDRKRKQQRQQEQRSKKNTRKTNTTEQADDESLRNQQQDEAYDEANEKFNDAVDTCKKVPKVGELDLDCDIPIILEDNCCSCNVASAERRLASHNYEIIYVNYKVNVNIVPFLVAADHSKRAIVVAIRGSMSLSDMVTDMNGQVDSLPIQDCPPDWLCHRGITRAAMYVKLMLEQERIIERALNCRPDLASQDYTLVLCGHSLGAGAAAILGILMRPQYPNLKAYLYSPPGGILSMPVVEYTKEFAIGIILGNDTVPRLGVAQLERLRYQTLLSIKSSRKSSSKILAKALCPTCCFGDNEVEYDPVHSLDLLHGTEGRSFEYSGTTIPFQSQSQVLYVPGRLIHVVKNYSFQSKKSNKTTRLWRGPIYQAVWTDNDIYDRIIISEGMFFDHLPNKLMHAMKMLFSKTLPGRRESCSSANGERVSAATLVRQDSKIQRDMNKGPRVDESATAYIEHNVKVLQDYDNNNNCIDNDENDDNNNNNYDRKAFPNFNSLKREEQEHEFCHNNEKIPTTNGAIILNKVDLDENGNEQC